MPSRSAPAPAPQVLEEIAFQKAMVARLRREIGDVDRTSRRGYIKEFHSSIGRYQAPASWDDLVIACYRADLVYIGDYHALPSAQETAARLIQAIAERSRAVVLGVEMVYGRHQRLLDRYMNGELDELAFLRAIRYESDWGYDWAAFRTVYDVARRHHIPVVGLDCPPRTGFRHIRRRDRYAAERIAGMIASAPGARAVVLFGESHLAPAHLPKQVTKLLKRHGLEKRVVTVVQNLEEIYWQMSEAGHAGSEAARLGDDVYCHFSAGPIAKYEAYRRTIELWKGEDESQDDPVDLTSTVHGIIDMILRFLKIDPYTRRLQAPGRGRDLIVDLYPDIHSGLEPDEVRVLFRNARLPEEDAAEVLDHLERSGSCYVPRLNAIFLGEFSLVHAGEEAAHFVNQLLKGEIYEAVPRALPQHDLFYSAVLEEALGFFGSKIVDPSRNHFFENEFYQYYRKDRETIEKHTPYKFDEFNEIIDFVLLHKKFEHSYEHYGEVPQPLLDGIRSDPRRVNVLVHELGYFLGQQLHDAYRMGLVDRADMLALFRASFRRSGSALAAYLDLSRKVAPALKGGLTPAGSG
ncbi:MAG TPA: ChaN family lipoprotein [Verrucomicrobiae bacterium]|nr:ChaN family lipoprotein [Verrucomicrobiae bacterium]